MSVAAAEKISVYNLSDLKNTSDDAIPNYLNSLKIKQVHTLTDVRLALGYGAFAIAAACFLWDYKLGFESTKYYTAAAVAIYTLLNGALTLWIWAVEKGTVYEGVTPSGDKISISTSTKKNVPTYNVKITVVPKVSPNKPQIIEVSRSFTEWFDETGRFITPPFQTLFASAIPAVGQLDPKRANPDSAAEVAKASGASEVSSEMLDAIYGAADAGSTATEKKGGKRRKA